MSDSLAVSRYARALFHLADDKKQLDQAMSGYDAILKIVSQHPEISHLVLNSTIARDEKEDFLDKVFEGAAKPFLIHFLKVLVRKRRFSQLTEIHREFEKLYQEKKKIKEVMVTTAVPLAKETRSRLMKVLHKALDSEIRLVDKVEPKILGGMILSYGSKEINGSFRHRLQEITQTLLA